MIIAKDKFLHALLGAYVGSVTYVTVLLFSPENAALYAAIMPAAAGIAKEIWDYATERGTPEFADAVATALPGPAFLLLDNLRM